ncbi:DUF4238 domain-containing protein [Oceanobacillus kimchii]|uniref:DUF4238 domain-containing protein n=1 Tax=Oceanobacillus kimchii TaxID=746691 RepID=UPI0021A7E30E|nr:DUF4238 domain-containing protein [Oceanobacillus kimchii]MCT1577049.1 DUF4238 domain-containing protein [Oceanobacillus kimchii]MCT2135119.1 DUF4238 domain-containing protein [Oceanobacillus kimchii]
MKGTYVTKQHYVSKFLLKNFANEKDQVFESLVDMKKVYPTNINQSMCEKFVYEHSELDKNSLEKAFSDIESFVAPKIEYILQLLEDGNFEIKDIKNLVNEILYEIIIFYYRSGAVLHEMSFQKENKDQQLSDLLKQISNSKYLKSLSRTIYDNYNFAIIKNERDDFLISDQFISTASLDVKSRFANISNRHIGLKGVIILIPISSKFYIVFYDGDVPFDIQKDRMNVISSNTLNLINKCIINNCYNKCVSYNREVLEESLQEFKKHSPVGAILSYKSGLHESYILKKEVFFYENDEKAYNLFANLEFQKYENVKRNQVCPCDSGRKFKKCCLSAFENAEIMKNHIMKNVSHKIYMVNPEYVSERSIAELKSFEEPELLKQVKEASR